MTVKILKKPVHMQALNMEHFNKLYFKLRDAFDALLDTTQRWAYKAQVIGNVAQAQNDDYDFRNFPLMVAYLGNDLSEDIYKSPEMIALIEAMKLLDELKQELS